MPKPSSADPEIFAAIQRLDQAYKDKFDSQNQKIEALSKRNRELMEQLKEQVTK